MKTLSRIVLFLLVSAVLFSVPVSDARFLELKVQYTLHSDGSWDQEVHQRVRLDTYLAINRALGETFIVTSPAYQKLEILKAETTMADGKVVKAPDNAFNEVLPFGAHGFAAFSELREMVVTHTGLERGAIVDLHYRIHTKAGFLPVFSGREALTRSFPIDHHTLTLTVPAGQTLHVSVVGAEALVKTWQNGSEVVYGLERQNVAPMLHEPMSSPRSEPFILFSASSDWAAALSHPEDSSTLPEIWLQRLAKLQAGSQSASERLQALQRMVAQDVRNCPLGIETTGWKARNVETVAQSNYATRLEKALLLKAVLKQAGFSAELLAVSPLPLAEGAAALQQFQGFWLTLKQENEALYLDPWSRQQRFFPDAIAGWTALNLDTMKVEKLPLTSESGNGIQLTGALDLKTTGVSGNIDLVVRGRFHRPWDAASDAAAYAKSILSLFFPVEKVDLKKLSRLTQDELMVSLDVQGNWLSALGAAADACYSLDQIHLPGMTAEMVQLRERQTALLLDGPFETAMSLSLRPETGLDLELAAPALQQENELGSFVRSLGKAEDGTLQLTLRYGLNQQLVEPQDYPRLRALLLPGFEPGPLAFFRKK
jgi:hypothetical protein